MNILIATGNLGKDAVLRNTQSGAVSNFSVAMKAGYGQNEQTVWVKCSMWGKRAESLNQYLVKGQTVAISGEASLRSWTTKEGEVKTDLECRINELTLIGKKDPEPAPAQQSIPDAVPDLGNDDIEDDIPF